MTSTAPSDIEALSAALAVAEARADEAEVKALEATAKALHEHGPTQAAEDDSLTRSATNPKPNVRKILDTTPGRAISRAT